MKRLKIFPQLFFTAAICLQIDAFAFTKCIAQLSVNPEVVPIVGKFAMNSDESRTFVFLVNSDKVNNDQERKAIQVYILERKKCDQLLQPFPSELVGHRSTQNTAFESAASELYLGNITWGEFAKLRNKINDSFVNAQIQYRAKLKAQDRAEEDFRRKAILDILINRTN